ncbi:MAG: ABC transporter permease [Bacteroidales bacterium]|nr:ABC transporter permease [Bacteroidales bacterium]
MEVVKIAWRNIWRNKRRTLITASSLMFAVIFGVSMRSMQLGTYDNMIDSAVRQYSGFIQIQDTSYWKDKTIDDLMPMSTELATNISEIEGVKSVLPRLESFALISSGTKTKGALLQGIDPLRDVDMTGIADKVVKGRFIEPGDDGFVIGQRLAAYLKINVGDTIVLISQGYHGVTAADIYPIRGILKIPNPNLDKLLLIGDISTVQRFYGAEGMLTSLVVNIEDKNSINTILPQINEIMTNKSLVALSWTDMNKELKQQIDADDGGGIVMLIILYSVVFFGILGTIIMMTAERKKEFAVMVALGMQKGYLSIIVLLETLFLGMIGAVVGALVSSGIVWYFHDAPIHITGEMADIYEQFGIEPVLMFSTDLAIIQAQFVVVLSLLIMAVIYPMVKIRTFSIMESMRSK